MRTSWILALVLLLSSAVVATAADLPRRGVLGLALSPTEDGQAFKITKVLNPNAPEVQENDIVVSINRKPLSGPKGVGVGGATYGLKQGQAVRVSIIRNGKPMEVTVTAFAAPPPVLDGRPVELGSAQAQGGPRVRTLFLDPVDQRLARDGRVPAVMILPGIPCGTVEGFSNPADPYAKLFRALTAQGFAVAMADKPGQGDSEGTPCLEGGYAVEEQAFGAAAERFVADRRVDPKRFYVIGLSMGALQSPMVAVKGRAAGIITWGGVVSPWYDYLLTTFARRSIIQGEDGNKIAAYRGHWRRILTAILVEGRDPAAVKRAMPDSYAIVAEEVGGDLSDFAERSWTFHREADKAPTVSAWNAFDGRLLSLHGEYDWVSEMHDHRLAADIVNRRHPGHALFEVIPGNDHVFTKHKSLADSFAKFGQGAPDEAFYSRTIAWLQAEASR
jgi:dienelactone hydrolase